MINIIKLLSSFEKFFATLFMGLMTVFVIMDVFSREIWNTGIPWAQKSAVYLMLWTALLGAISISEKAAHLRPEVGDKLFGDRFPWPFVRVQNLFTLIFCIIMSYASILYLKDSIEFAEKSVVLGFEIWIIQLIIPYTFISMGLRNFYFLINPQVQLDLKKDLF